MKKDIALFDENCELCRQSKRIFERLDSKDNIIWIPFQKRHSFSEIPNDLKEEDVRAELHLLTNKGKWLKGFYAVRRLLRRNRYLFWTALLLYLPYVDRLGNPLYRLIAAKRYEVLKKSCKNGSCDIPKDHRGSFSNK